MTAISEVKTYQDLKIFLDSCGDINGVDEKTGLSLLFFLEETKAIELAIEKGIDCSFISEESELSPLFYAKTPEILKIMLSWPEINIHHVDSAKQNAILYHSDTPENVELLVKAGVDINQRDAEGCTFLFNDYISAETQLALLKNHIDIIDLNIKEDFGFGLNAFLLTKEAFDIVNNAGFIAENFFSPYYIGNTKSEENPDNVKRWEFLKSMGVPIPQNIAFKDLTLNEVDFLLNENYDFNLPKSNEKKDKDSSYSNNEISYPIFYQNNPEVLKKLVNTGIDIHVIAKQRGFFDRNILTYAYEKNDTVLFSHILYEYDVQSLFPEDTFLFPQYKKILEEYKEHKIREEKQKISEMISIKKNKIIKKRI